MKLLNDKEKDLEQDDLYKVEDEEIKTVFQEERKIVDEEEEDIPQNKEEYQVQSNLITDSKDGLSPIGISKEMRKSFLEYAMSVIVARALPDARDGLKPVHRRILFGMHELGIISNSPHKKSARIVGEVLGKYHPHGDSSVYDAMARMAQDFSMRYILVDGHGNFGSIDGDEPAAMRYTEARMSKIAHLLIDSIKKNTVDFGPNYDSSEEEPLVLPARFPNLLVNGATGIAVGMATSIPPHNLNEIINGIIQVIRNPKITIEELAEYIVAPDFPTAGLVIGKANILNGYKTGRGFATIRSKVKIEELKNGKKRIVVTEIPYMVNKSKLVEKIAELVRSKNIEGISDLRDESSNNGIRIVIEIKKSVYPEIIINKLFKMTSLQTNFSFNMLALVNGEPKLLNLKQLLEVFVEHQIEIVTRRTTFDLNKNKERVHILLGIKIAIENIDRIINIIKISKNDQEASNSLAKEFALSSQQTKAIIDMRLGRLTSLAISKMEQEISEINVLISKLENILNNELVLKELIVKELEEIKNKFGDDRRSEFLDGEISIDDEDLIPKKDIVITMSSKGYVKRIALEEFQNQKRGGVGSRSMSTYDDDDVFKILTTSTHKDLLIFTSFGKVYRLRTHQIPELSKQAKGMPFVNLIAIDKNEEIISWVDIENYEENKYLITITKNGIIKKTALSLYQRINKNGKYALKMKENDILLSVMIANHNDEIIIGTNKGQVNRFSLESVRPLSRTAFGVIGIKFNDQKTKVIGASSFENEELFVFSLGKDGFGKLTSIKEYRKTNRGSKGVKTINVNKAGELIFIGLVKGDEDFLVTTKEGITIRTSLEEVPRVSRNTKGVKIIKLANNNKIRAVSIIDVI